MQMGMAVGAGGTLDTSGRRGMVDKCDGISRIREEL